MLASTFLKKGGVLVSCDYSKNMVTKLATNYQSEENDYSLVEGNKSFIDLETNYVEFSDESCSKLKNHCDLESIVNAQGEFKKFVFGCQANNELLPFPDNYFNAYIANLSVMLVNKPIN